MPSVIAMMRDGPFAAIATRIIAGCTWWPSQMSSAATSSLARTAPARPGSRCVIGGMRLKRCVAWRAPAAIAACACSYVAPEWPSDTRCRAADERADESRPPVELGRERDDADVGPRAIDHVEDLARREVS